MKPLHRLMSIILFLIYPFFAQAQNLILAYGMSYSSFATYTKNHGYGEPKAITSVNNKMYYTLPYQPEIQFVFNSDRLEKVTHVSDSNGSMHEEEILLSDSFNCRWRYSICFGDFLP